MVSETALHKPDDCSMASHSVDESHLLNSSGKVDSIEW